jgi:hypothetical protein
MIPIFAQSVKNIVMFGKIRSSRMTKMDNIYQLVYYEGDEKHIVWSANKVELDEMIKGWEEQGFGTGDDIIKKISFNDKSELVDQLNNLENKS